MLLAVLPALSALFLALEQMLLPEFGTSGLPHVASHNTPLLPFSFQDEAEAVETLVADLQPVANPLKQN